MFESVIGNPFENSSRTLWDSLSNIQAGMRYGWRSPSLHQENLGDGRDIIHENVAVRRQPARAANGVRRRDLKRSFVETIIARAANSTGG
jgi:hypothetical protein